MVSGYNEIIRKGEEKGVNKMGKIIFVNDHKFYYEFDGIRLIYEDNQLTGWYNPELSREEV